MPELKLTRERKKLGQSQSDLMRSTGLHPATICNIEKGRLKAWPSQAKKIEVAMRKAGWDGKGDLFEEVGE